ncbi:MAG TPA: metal ABC transporter substrate-binding protein [Planctomycetota bacterium]
MRIALGVATAIVFVVLLVLFARGTPSSPHPAASKLQVSATIFPLADWLHEIGGPDLDVHLLVSGGANPHHFEPGIQDVSQITRSRAVFTVGLGLDPWAPKLAANAGNIPVIETGTWITPRKLSAHEKEHDDGHGHGDFDPHYWLDPQRAMIVVKQMAEELGKLDSAHMAAFTQRAEAYVQKLKELDVEVQTAAKSVPAGAQLVSFHDAFGYLFARLNIAVAAAIQSSPGVEPSTRDVAEALRRMKEIGQKTVFVEPMSSTRTAVLIAQELGGNTAVLDPMDSQLGADGKTYIERLRYDVQVLLKAVQK